MRYKVLWVEDNAEADLFHFLAPVNVDGRFDVDIAVNATEACSCLTHIKYDVVIMDTRIPAGHDPFWRNKEEDIIKKSEKPIVRLGLEILKSILNNDPVPAVHAENRDEKKFCIFSIDPISELKSGDRGGCLEPLIYNQKQVSMARNILVTMITESLRNQRLVK